MQKQADCTFPVNAAEAGQTERLKASAAAGPCWERAGLLLRGHGDQQRHSSAGRQGTYLWGSLDTGSMYTHSLLLKVLSIQGFLDCEQRAEAACEWRPELMLLELLGLQARPGLVQAQASLQAGPHSGVQRGMPPSR